MSALDWPSVDANGVSLPSIVSSSDLFDGELFGDELIDIYNSAVVDDAEHQGVHDEIPHLMHNPSSADSHHNNCDESSHMVGTNAAMGDGLGAFRHSTSFSDLTTLLTDTAEAIGSTAATAPAIEVSVVAEAKMTKKRPAAAVATTASSPKRRASATKSPPRRVSVSSKKQSPSTSKVPAVVGHHTTVEKPGTPDPLVMAALPTVSPLPSPPLASVTVQKPATTKIVVVKTEEENAMDVVPTPVLSIPPQDCLSASSRSNSESDFKSIAQVAVSNLMTGGSTSSKDSCVESCDFDEKVDISTDHIKALTGNNWVAACGSSGGSSVAPPVQATDPKSINRTRRQNLTPDERARQNRDRNREHARNTRLRKKAYVEELKRTLMEMVSQRDAADLEKRQSAQRELEQREVRFRVIEEFLKLRGRNETNFARWAAILEDGFSLAVPVTDYRKAISGSRLTTDQILCGVSDVMGDSNSFADFLQTLGDGKSTVAFQYHCDRSNFFMDGNTAFLEWNASSVGCAATELVLKGMMRAKFSPASNKLLSASLSFDSGTMLSLRTFDSHCSNAAEIAAAEAADAILDSLEMPRLAVPVPTAVNIVHSSSSTDGSDEKGELDSDDSISCDKSTNGDVPMATVSCSG